MEYDKILLSSCMHYFKSDLIINADHKPIAGILPASFCLKVNVLFICASALDILHLLSMTIILQSTWIGGIGHSRKRQILEIF